LAHELEVIQTAGLADYFLIVWDIVRHAREQGIRCQGRGSAANSLVAYVLGITPVDPLRYDLLFERFLSDQADTMPDIDIDFAADRRDEVIAYVYERYGADHAAMVCNVVTYQARQRGARRGPRAGLCAGGRGPHQPVGAHGGGRPGRPRMAKRSRPASWKRTLRRYWRWRRRWWTRHGTSPSTWGECW